MKYSEILEIVKDVNPDNFERISDLIKTEVANGNLSKVEEIEVRKTFYTNAADAGVPLFTGLEEEIEIEDEDDDESYEESYEESYDEEEEEEEEDTADEEEEDDEN